MLRQWRYGYELGRRGRAGSGSLYPILVRLSDRELLESRWEADARRVGHRGTCTA